VTSDGMLLAFLFAFVGGVAVLDFYGSLSGWQAGLFLIGGIVVSIAALMFIWSRWSKPGRERRKRIEQLRSLPPSLLVNSNDSVRMGEDQDLKVPIFLPDSIRSRHVHILGATGSGKSESVILNFLRQDVTRNLGSVVLDAKGDASFMSALKAWVPEGRLKIFDLGSEKSLTYDPIAAGSPLEAAQRLFSSFTWSEEYYKHKALSALQRLFQRHFEAHDKNPTLMELSAYLEEPASFAAMTVSQSYPKKLAQAEFMDLSGLRDQIRTLCTGYLANILSPEGNSDMNLQEATDNKVLYFRLQSLLSPQLVAIVGKLLINQLNYMAGTAHRGDRTAEQSKLVPIYLDEFATFASPEFGELISKARSAGFALHFSHQSIGDLMEVSKGFINRVTDNAATKIVLRINDPDSAEFFARSFGTKIYQKITQRITNVKDIESAEAVGEGTQREAHQFRAPPDLFKTLPTGVGSVLIAHGYETPNGASSVFRIGFPRLAESRNV
jgi:hypothetical protein